MQQLFDVCCPESLGVRRVAWEVLLERERQGETFVGADVLIPHARLAGLTHPLLALGLAQAGIRDPATGRPVTFLFMLLSPAEPAACHVNALGTVCSLARDDQWRKRAVASGNPEELARDLSAILESGGPRAAH